MSISASAYEHSQAAEWLVAHRGYPARFPENTREGVHAALAGGALHVEFDVHLSADGRLVVIHDDTLDRTSGGSGNVHELSYAELSRMSVGEPARFGERFNAAGIVSLADMLDVVAGFPGATAYVELKRGSMRRFGRDAVVNAAVEELCKASCPLVVLSFDAQMVAAVRAATALPIGWVFERWNESARAEAGQLQPEYVFTSADSVPAAPRPFWPGPWRWAVYDVDDVATALALRERGADMIETDYILDFFREMQGE